LLVEIAERRAAEYPLLIMFEDLHWSDPTTRELLTILVERALKMRVLVVMTARPDFEPPWQKTAPVERLELRRFVPEETMQLVARVAGDIRILDSTMQQMVARADGIPLFIEELTKVVMSGEQSIPATLQDSLMARLDRLGQAKHIAQVAGALGREFARDLLAAVVDVAPALLQEGLQVLEDAGLIRRLSIGKSDGYLFKHALIQEAAYQSLLRRRRRELHGRIAQVLETQFPGTARDTPELVAHHRTEAGNADRATYAWLMAGRRASERSQDREAIGHLRNGLALIPELSDPVLRRERELALRLALGPAIITTEGAGTPEVSALYSRTLDLCEGHPPSPAHFAAGWGWWRASMDLRTGRERADDLVRLAESLNEPDLLLQAHHCQWATLYMLGALQECCGHIERGLGMYDAARHHAHAATYGGHDVRVCGLGELAVARWLLGHPEAAVEHVRLAVTSAEALSHVGSRAHAMDYALVLHKFRRDARAVAAHAGDLVAYAAEQKLRDYHAKGLFFKGWARAILEDAAEGLHDMNEAMASFQCTPEDVSIYHEMVAEVCARLGRHDQGLRAIDDAFAQTERSGILFWNAELHRRRGVLLAAAGETGSEVDQCFRNALDCAREQGAVSLELRAALSLARLHCAKGDTGALNTVLRPVYARFSEGFDTPDLLETRLLLDDFQ
jgi:predicted ATPase